MAKNVCVVIPIHSPNPTYFELISFKQGFSILGKYSIYIVAPEGLDLTEYYKCISHFQTIFINPIWQSSVRNYNKLKISRFFYNLFREYKFLLTYELDAFIFKDDIEFWCNKGYDYIGAPWFEGWAGAEPDADFIPGGNSGFSLRKIELIEKILKTWFYKNPVEYNSGYRNLIKAYLKSPYRWLKNQGGENYTIQNNYDHFEDVLWSMHVPIKFTDFKIAPLEDAIKFSFEVNPRRLYQLNDQKLPTGCHAWWRYDLDFWKPFIQSYGYSIEHNE